MGIKSFSKTFPHHGEIKFKDLRGKVVAVDAMYQLHRTAHPFKAAQHATLTAPDGTATNHINGLIALIFNFKKNEVVQVWIFDGPPDNHVQLKDAEVARRKSQRQSAKEKLEKILDEQQAVLFSDSEDDEKKTVAARVSADAAVARNKYERASFSLEYYMITDLQYMLDCFDIPWIEAPRGVEAEQLAAHMTNRSLDGMKADAVFTPDPDCLLFGARMIVKNDKTKLYKYDLQQLLAGAKINLAGLIKVGVALGCDFADKTPRIGPKSVLKKLDVIDLTDEQVAAQKYFAAPIEQKLIAPLRWHRDAAGPFASSNKIHELFEWIVGSKGFNRERTRTRFASAKIDVAARAN